MMWIEQLLSLADRVAAVRPGSPGRFDPRATEKLAREREELAEALAVGDTVGAWTEVADVVYYAAKCVATQRMTKAEAQRLVEVEAAGAGLDFAAAVRVAAAKYEARSGSGCKDDQAEREAVKEVVLWPV